MTKALKTADTAAYCMYKEPEASAGEIIICKPYPTGGLVGAWVLGGAEMRPRPITPKRLKQWE